MTLLVPKFHSPMILTVALCDFCSTGIHSTTNDKRKPSQITSSNIERLCYKPPNITERNASQHSMQRWWMPTHL